MSLPWLGAALALLALLGPSTPLRSAEREPVRLIFDTDIGADIDDALALAMIHAFEARGDCRLLAVTLTNAHPLSAPLVDAINTFYGRPDIPIGLARNGLVRGSPYLEVARLHDGGHLRFPRKVQDTGAGLPDAVHVLRKVLVAQPDHSVVISQVGMSSNLADLLASKADGISPLDGKELARRKVKLVSIMGGAFVPIDGNRHYGEYNIKMDLPASRKLAAQWPTPIVWSGFEIGLAVPYPAVSIERDYTYVKHHPIAEAYRRYSKMPYDRPTWDLTAVLYAIQPDRGYFDLSLPGRVTVQKDASTTFTPAVDGLHRYLILRPGQRARVQEALVQLASQPPLKGKR